MIACVNFYDPQVVELVNGDVPVVTIDHVFNNRMAVLSDNVNGLSALVRYAYANGHRRNRLYPWRAHGGDGEPAGGLLPRAVAELGCRSPKNMCEAVCITIPTAVPRRPGPCWHCHSGPPASSSPMISPAMGGCIALQEAGLSIPEDISVMGYDGIYLSRVMKPQLVTWQQNTKMLGRMAADKLVQMIEHPRVTLAEQIPVTGKLLEGGSVRSIE